MYIYIDVISWYHYHVCLLILHIIVVSALLLDPSAPVVSCRLSSAGLLQPSALPSSLHSAGRVQSETGKGHCCQLPGELSVPILTALICVCVQFWAACPQELTCLTPITAVFTQKDFITTKVACPLGTGNLVCTCICPVEDLNSYSSGFFFSF